MLTLLKNIFTWWNRDTFGTRLKTIFFGKLVGSDELGNKYYENKNGKRWVIYANTIDASKIPVEWYSWMHFTPNKIEKNHELEKYDWQKPHQSNLTGTDDAYYHIKHLYFYWDNRHRQFPLNLVDVVFANCIFVNHDSFLFYLE